ncbi:MAG: hypothetical protein IKA54_05765 [Clostridia bacterium]|nr:hypothetical protein [Clostridia bacterium]
MKILFISASPINNSVSVGNTFLNVFNGLKDIEFYSIYSKSGFPDTKISKAFRITEKNIVKKFINWRLSVGELVNDRYDGQFASDSSALKLAKSKRWSIFFFLRNLIWNLPFWKSKNLKKFLDEVQPDVIFTVLSNSAPLNKLIKFVVNYTKKPLILYAWDDNYSFSNSKSPFKKLLQLNSRKHMRNTVKLADKFYVISKIQQQDYEKWFTKPCKILTKSADFSSEPPIKKEYGKPLQIVYTGNVLLNRWRSLEIIASALQKINVNGVKAQLRIYTGNTLTEEMNLALNKGESSIVMGSVPASEVYKIQQDADMLVHVEGLDEKSAQLVRHSFSTKLVDYFKMARPILAVGPRGVASIEHLIENDCVIYADNECKLVKKLSNLIQNYYLLDELSLKAYNCGKLNHDDSIMKNLLKNDLEVLKN